MSLFSLVVAFCMAALLGHQNHLASDCDWQLTEIHGQDAEAVAKTLRNRTKIDDHVFWWVEPASKRRIASGSGGAHPAAGSSKPSQCLTALFVPRLLAAGFKQARCMQYLEAEGYVVLEKYVPSCFCDRASEFCISHTKALCS